MSVGEKKKAGGWENLNGMSNEKKTCGINDMNCLEEGEAVTCSINVMNCVEGKKDL